MRFGGLCAILLGCGPPPSPAIDAATGDLVGTADAGSPDRMASSDAAPMGNGKLWFVVTDRDTSLPAPARVIFRPPPPDGFGDASRSTQLSLGVYGTPEGVMLQNGFGVVAVPQGRYSLFITRGPEYEAVETVVTVEDHPKMVSAELDHSVDTRGWLSADMHVHTGRSFDSKIPLDARVVSMVTSGVEIIVPTDHNVATDLGPTIAALAYGSDTVGTIVGNEFNFSPGHGGAYPIPYDNSNPTTGGALGWSTDCGQMVGANCQDPATAFGYHHALIPGTTVVSINHPWAPGSDLGYFTNIGWGAGTGHPLPAVLSTAGQFDALEISSGYWARSDAYSALLADWFFLLNGGYRVTALGNSDTHKVNNTRGGYPRTWLRLPNDAPGETTGTLLSQAILNHRAVASTGPFVELTVDGADIGDTVMPAVAGQVSVAITVDAPGWMKVDAVKVYVNGLEKHNFSPVPGQRPVFKTNFVEPFLTDGWIVVIATGTQPLPGDVVGEFSHNNSWEMLPWALTNPIFVDANRDSQWKPPQPWDSMTPSPFRSSIPDPVFPVPDECGPAETDRSPSPVSDIDYLMPLLQRQ